MANKKKSPLADELKKNAYKSAAGLGAMAGSIATKQTGLGAKAISTANKQTGLGAKAISTANRQTGIGAKANAAVKASPSVAKPIASKAYNSVTKPAVTKPAVTKPAVSAKPATVKPVAKKPAAATTAQVAPAAPAQTPAVPYETPEQIRARYEQQLNDYDAQKRAEAERLRQQYNSQFNNAQRDNYINYMITQRDLPQRLAEQGITGGMSETANLQSRTNYENLYAGTEGQRRSALQDVDNDYADALYNYRAQADANMNTELAENRQLRSEYEQQMQEQNEERFANNLGAYDTPAKVEAAKRDAIAKGETWKIPYLNQQGATLRQQAEATKQAAQERKEETFVNTIERYDTVKKCDNAIAAAKKNGETWKIPYLSQHKASLKQQGKAEDEAKQERKEQRFANNLGAYDTVEKCNNAIAAAKKNGETWKIPYLRQHKADLKQQGKAETQAQQERKEQRFVNNIGGYDTVEKCDNAIAAAKKNGETWKIPYLRQQKANIKKEDKTEKQARTERYEQRYANTISGFNSIDAINKEIKKIQKSGKNTWRIAYLRARRTELINAGQTGTGTGSGTSGGSSGGKSSGRSGGGGGGGGGGADTPKEETTQKKEEKKQETPKNPYEEAAKKKKKEAKKKWKGKVKEAKEKGGLLHTGNKKNTGTVTKPYYSQAGYANGYRYVR